MKRYLKTCLSASICKLNVVGWQTKLRESDASPFSGETHTRIDTLAR